jgi:hypothetical protein
MAKITRATQTIFGGTGSTSNFGQFGSLAASSPTTTKTPSVIQGLAAWLAGWQAATIGAFIPAYQDMNSVHYLAFYQICYILQMGIAEYDSSTTYYTNSIVQYNGVQYQSLIDNNTGNEPDANPNSWKCISSNVYGGTVASASSMTLPNLGNSFKVTGTTTINNISAEPAGIEITLIFTTNLLVNTGGNILLNNGVFNTTTTSTLSLISDGSNWYEMARSPIALGSTVSVTAGIAYQVPYDSLVTAMLTTGGSIVAGTIVSDSSPSPSFVKATGEINGGANNNQALTLQCKVKKGNYFQINNAYGASVVAFYEQDS